MPYVAPPIMPPPVCAKTMHSQNIPLNLRKHVDLNVTVNYYGIVTVGALELHVDKITYEHAIEVKE